MKLKINIKESPIVKFIDLKDQDYFTYGGLLYVKTIMNNVITNRVLNCFCINTSCLEKMHEQTIVTRIKSLNIDAETE